MENKTKKPTTYLIIGGVIIVILFMLFIVLSVKQKNSDKKTTKNLLPQTQEVLPTIGPSTIVAVMADKNKQNVTLTIEGIPEEVTSIDFEMVYDHDLTKRDIAEGAEGTRKTDAAIGTIKVDKTSIERKILLGTCSATCTYHTGVTSVNVLLKFVGGEQTKKFEKEFPL